MCFFPLLLVSYSALPVSLPVSLPAPLEPSLVTPTGVQGVEAQEHPSRAFDARMAVYEGRRGSLEQAFDVASTPFSSEAARELLAEVQQDGEVPEWYTGEIAALAGSFVLVEELDDEARDATLAALRVRPHPASAPQGIIDEFEGAIEELAKTLGPSHPVISQRYFFLSNITAQAGRWDDSVKYAEAAVEAAEGLVGERGAQTALRRMWLGWTYRGLSRTEEAEAALLMARATLDRLGTSDLGVWVAPRAHLDNYLGTLYTDLDRLDEAEPLLTDFVLRAEETFGRGSTAHIGGLNNLAILLTRIQRHDRAVGVFTRCLELAEAGLPPGSPFLAKVLVNLGMSEQQVGRFHEARGHLNRAIELIDPQHLQKELAVHARLQLARVALLEGREDEAVQWASEAIADPAAMSVVPSERALINDVLVWTMIRMELWERAETYLSDFEASGEDVFPWHTEFFRVILDARTKKGPEVREDFEALINGLEADEPPGSGWVSSVRSRYAWYLRGEGALDEALEQLEKAGATYQESRGQRVEGFGRSSFHASPQPFEAQVAFELGRVEQALGVLEAWRGRSLHDLIQAAGDSQRAIQRTELARAERALAALENGLSARGSAAPQDRPEADSTRALLRLKRDRLQEALATPVAAAYSQPSSLAELRGALHPGELYAGWTLVDYGGQETLLAWTLGSSGPPRMTRIQDGSAVFERMVKFAEGLGSEAQSVFEPDPESVKEEARALGDLLFALVPGKAQAPQHLLLVPGELDGLPFEALMPGGEWAGERWTMSYAPSGTLHALLRARTSRPAFLGSVLAVGDPQLREESYAGERVAVLRSGMNLADLPDVPASGLEAKAIAAMYPRSLVLTGRDANEQSLSVIGAEHSVIHIASHALIGGSDPHATGIVLSQVDLPDPYELALAGKRPVDGFLSVPEIASEWKLDADLVALSACRSALGPAVRGEGYVGLSSALFQAGAGAVLASLWEVQDEPTRLFMESFYREWRALAKEGSSARAKAVALREARRTLREFEVAGRRPYAHPAFWSAFVLIGNPD